ncbi:xylose operon regulatory protein, partial [mine drainage metagenome]
MVSNDQLALMILSTCSEAGIRVPEDVAVLGVDDDELMCAMANPPLSSIPFPAKRVGYEAVAVIEALMAGEAAPDEPVVLPPLPIVTRGSTERLAVSDPDVDKALALIHANIGRRFNVSDLTDNLAVSRRSLERKFHRELSTGIQDEIRRSRVEHART